MKKKLDLQGYEKVIEGEPWFRDAHLDSVSDAWVVSFIFPILSQFDDASTIGILEARWEIDSLEDVASEKRKYSTILLRARRAVVTGSNQRCRIALQTQQI